MSQYPEKLRGRRYDNLRFLAVVSRTELRGTPCSAKQKTEVETAMKSLISSFLKNESGATAIEYGLIAAGIAIAIITAVNGVGSSLSTVFGNISTSLK